MTMSDKEEERRQKVKEQQKLAKSYGFTTAY